MEAEEAGGGAAGDPAGAAVVEEGRAGVHTLNIIPQPACVELGAGEFWLTPETVIYVPGGNPELRWSGEYLAARLKPSTGYSLPVQTVEKLATPGLHSRAGIYLNTQEVDPDLGEEGYLLKVTPEAIYLSAYQPAGIFWGIQTVRQILPPEIESTVRQEVPWKIPAVIVRDLPRYSWRGAMLDVARHFFSVQDVKRYIDLLAYYKINRFHMHLTDDQGWRLMIESWPNLALHGGSTATNGDPGGYYTQAEYTDIVNYAQERYIVVVPEIDIPGHTNAALASYPDLNCSGIAPDLFTGMRVGFSSLCIQKEVTYRFLEDVIRELAAMTPGLYLHIGGDEAEATLPEEYEYFINRVQAIVAKYGKQVAGWEEIATADLHPGTIVQVWNGKTLEKAIERGNPLIVSLATRTYLDIKYDASTELGQDWAGYVEVKDAYEWDPVTELKVASQSRIMGVEACLWTETTRTLHELEYMTLPRLPGLAEIAWTPAEGRSWDEYRHRLAAQGKRWQAMGVAYYRARSVPWV